MRAALQPLSTAQGDLDLGSEESTRGQDPSLLERCRRYLAEWVEDPGTG